MQRLDETSHVELAARARTVDYYPKKQSFRYVDVAIVDTDSPSRSIGRRRTTERGDRWECECLPLSDVMRYNCNRVMTIARTAPSRQLGRYNVMVLVHWTLDFGHARKSQRRATQRRRGGRCLQY